MSDVLRLDEAILRESASAFLRAATHTDPTAAHFSPAYLPSMIGLDGEVQVFFASLQHACAALSAAAQEISRTLLEVQTESGRVESLAAAGVAHWVGERGGAS